MVGEAEQAGKVEGVPKIQAETGPDLRSEIAAWIEIASSGCRYLGEMYPLEDWKQNLQRMGLEAPQELREKYEWVTGKIASYSELIEELSKLQKQVEQGRTTLPGTGTNIDSEFRRLVNSLY